MLDVQGALPCQLLHRCTQGFVLRHLCVQSRPFQSVFKERMNTFTVLGRFTTLIDHVLLDSLAVVPQWAIFK
jgi:hypothetical protein